MWPWSKPSSREVRVSINQVLCMLLVWLWNKFSLPWHLCECGNSSVLQTNCPFVSLHCSVKICSIHSFTWNKIVFRFQPCIVIKHVRWTGSSVQMSMAIFVSTTCTFLAVLVIKYTDLWDWFTSETIFAGTICTSGNAMSSNKSTTHPGVVPSGECLFCWKFKEALWPYL